MKYTYGRKREYGYGNSFITIGERGGNEASGRDGMINEGLTVFGTYIQEYLTVQSSQEAFLI
jgi:hypothetical protein